MTPEQRIAVLTRDGGCVAVQVDPDAGECHGRLTVDHVRHAAGALTDSDPRWCVSLCERHHLESMAGRVWALAHRAELRAYLASRYEQVA